jgi:hypothetical protein
VWRSSDGKFRLDTPTTSVISDPVSQHTILLDHLKKEAIVMPTPPATPGATVPGVPQAPAAGAPQPPPVHVQDLGKSMIEGHEVEGKRFTLPAMPSPAMPQVPQAKPPGSGQIPGTATAPGSPQPPAVPAAPKPPKIPKMPLGPSVTEVWTSVKLKIPVLTKISTPVGEQTTYCKPTSTAEPHPSLFQVPQGYKVKPNP